MGHRIGGAHDPSAPAGHLPALRAGRNPRADHRACFLSVNDPNLLSLNEAVFVMV